MRSSRPCSEQGLPAAGGMTFLQARTANEVLKAQERRLRLQQLKGELVDRARAVSLVFRLARDERDAWSGWPARIAAVLAAELGCDTHHLQTVLDRHVREHLDAAGRAPPRAPLSPTAPPPWPQAWAQGLRPEPALSVAAWADRHRVLSPRASAEPGRWRTARTPYLARDHGRPVAGAPGAADRVHEGCPGRRHRGRQQLAGLPDPPRPRSGPGGPADGRAGQAVLAPAGRHPDRGDPGPARAGDARPAAATAATPCWPRNSPAASW